MEIKKDNTVIHLLFGSYTIGFIVGGGSIIISETNKTFDFNFSIGSFFCMLFLAPIIYWVYRFHGMVFNDASLPMKLLYFSLSILGIFGGGLFFWGFLH